MRATSIVVGVLCAVVGLAEGQGQPPTPSPASTPVRKVLSPRNPILPQTAPAQPATPAAARPSAGVPPQPSDDGLSTLERFLKIRVPGAPALAPDGTLYVRDWPDGIFQLFRIDGPAATPEAGRTQLTTFADGLGGYSLSPDGKTILLSHAVGGNENSQISVLDVATGAITPACANPKVQYSVNLWLDDSSGFLFTGNDESPTDFYLYRYDLASKTATKLLGRPGAWSAADISNDGTRVLVGEYRSVSDSSIYELNTSTGALTDLTPPRPAGVTTSVDWVGFSPDEQIAFLRCDIEDGRMKLWALDQSIDEPARRYSKPISALETAEVEGAFVNRQKSLLAVSTNEDGYGVVHVYRLPGLTEVALPAIERGVVSFNQLEGERVVWSLSNARTPGLAFTADLSQPNPVVTQITFAETQGLDLSGFPLPELVKFQSFDGLEIPAFLWTPKGFTKGGAIPFIVNYHGGPEGQFRPSFNATSQYLLDAGFGILQPNVRGSTGYGREFHMKDDYKKRWDSVRDGVLAAEWLVANGYATAGKIATNGGSYGGFMSVACLIEDQERVDAGDRPERMFGAGVNVVGITNVRTFLEKTSGYRRKLREVEYGPLSDPEFLDSVSSMNRIDKLKVPMFIAHGFNDPRVPVEEAMQLAVALKDKGLSPQLFIAPDEGHGFAKLDNRIYFTKRMSDFLMSTIGK